ncbi:uncharacterized protein TA05375 [Theileria annulata]|uniref:SfiI-subtelomeric related protein family member n=1 Tax=Theileria annulata TaxID=5874 RepID=Q4UCS9_THEAN|nr:uncharacterized protein TA05375 [Theileria annulata]CAI75372.1 hypothetical protein TA05375 [Theileria annulata]|eukprot:XP_954848.1 hypothetical protein TA05375 [Theileria annulata]
MCLNKIFLFTLFLANIQEIFASDAGQAAAKKDVTVNLGRFTEHCQLDPTKPNHLVKYYLCEPGDTKTFLKVVYEDVNLWNFTSAEGKTLKKLTLLVKYNFLQLLHFQLTKDSTDEDLYYKKEKKTFTKVDAQEFTNQRKFLGRRDNLVDKWFAFEMHNKELYGNYVTDSESLVDGVSRKQLSVSKGRPLLLRDGTQKVWEDVNHAKGLSKVEVYDFGLDKLMVLNLGSESKYFFKNLQTNNSQWNALSNENEFNTKAVQLKSSYFTTSFEMDLSTKPPFDNFTSRRVSSPGNLNELELMPNRTFFLNKVKFKEYVLWSSTEKQKRVFKMKLTLLDFEVRLVALYVTVPPDKVNPDHESLYFNKEDGVFRKLKDVEEYKALSKVVQSLSDKTSPFRYNDTWVQTGGKLDVTRYNDAEFTVEKVEGASKVLVTRTLTPKAGFTFTSLSHGSLALWPTAVRKTTGTVKSLELVSKDSLVQLVLLTVKTESTDHVLRLKKDGDNFTSVEQGAYDQFKELLKGDDFYADNKVHLDVNEENLNDKFFKVTQETSDGVFKKTVTVKELKVTNVKSLGHSLWSQNGDRYEFAKDYDLYLVGDSSLLVVHLETQGKRRTTKYFKKQDHNMQWVEMKSDAEFNNTLSAFKSANTPVKVDLDLSTSPSEAQFTVQVTPLRGNRTMLVLTPVKGKVVGVLNFKTTNLWTSNENQRGLKVHAYLEDYDVKFVKVDVLTVQNRQSQQSEVKKKWVSDTDWAGTYTDGELSTFKTTDNSKPFKYSSSWQLPSNKFDTKSFLAENFTVSEATDNLVKTTTYTPQTWMLVNQVLVDEVQVWPVETASVDQTKKLKLLEVLTKDHMVQLVHVQNVLLTEAATTEDLYFKKHELTYQKLDDVTKFNELKEKLSKKGELVDDKVKLDLSSEVPSTMFASETLVEDGLEKTVVEVKVGKLYQVKASPPLWTSQSGEYVTKLEKYSKDDKQFLVLHLHDGTKALDKKYFEKPTAVQPQQDAQRPEGAAARPSFQTVTSNTEFYKKLNDVKATLTFKAASLNLNSYQDQNFLVKESTEGTAKLYRLYPKAEFRVNSLLFGEVELWKKKKEGDRLVEGKVYVHDGKAKFFHGLVWEGDQNDQTTSSALYFQLNDAGNAYYTKQKEEFDKALEEALKTPPTPPSAAPPVVLPTKPRYYNKLLLSDTFDSQLFRTESEKKGEYTVKKVLPKGDDTFVNLVESNRTVLWKAQQKDEMWKSATLSLSEGVGLLDLVFTQNSADVHSYFLLQKSRWKKVESDVYQKEWAKVPSVQAPAS